MLIQPEPEEELLESQIYSHPVRSTAGIFCCPGSQSPRLMILAPDSRKFPPLSQAAHRPVKGEETSMGRALSCEGPQDLLGPLVLPCLSSAG